MDAQIVEVAAQPSAAVRVQQAMADLDLGKLFDSALPAIAARLESLGVTPAAPPYGRYHEFGPERADVEVGIPVERAVDLPPLAEVEPGAIGASELPGGEVAVTVHRGPYDTLGQTYDGLGAWIREQGRQPGTGPWESYRDNPVEATDVAQLRTDICWPLA